MNTAISTHAATASTLLALSKAVWRVVEALPALKEDFDILGFTVDELAAEIKSFGLQCESAHATLEERDTAQSVPGVDKRLWDCLAMQVDEASRTIQVLELFIKNIRREETRCLGTGQLEKSKEITATTKARVVRHVDDLTFTMILINM
jgi:hypothetical protein